jgi:hypothetical protein
MQQSVALGTSDLQYCLYAVCPTQTCRKIKNGDTKSQFLLYHIFSPQNPIIRISIYLPLWSSGQSSWLQIRRPGFDSRHYQKKK